MTRIGINYRESFDASLALLGSSFQEKIKQCPSYAGFTAFLDKITKNRDLSELAEIASKGFDDKQRVIREKLLKSSSRLRSESFVKDTDDRCYKDMYKLLGIISYVGSNTSKESSEKLIGITEEAKIKATCYDFDGILQAILRANYDRHQSPRIAMYNPETPISPRKEIREERSEYSSCTLM